MYGDNAMPTVTIQTGLWPTLFTVLLLICSGCNKDQQAENDLATLITIATEVVQKATSGDSVTDALASAQEYLNEQQSKLADAAERIKSLKGYQLSDDAMSKVKEKVQTAGATITRLRLELADEMARNPAVDEAVESIIRTYSNAVKGK